MPTPNLPAAKEVVAVLREWVVKAENDLKTAAHTLTLGKDTPTDTVCFHAQQCVEKYVKALLVFRATPFPKTHDLRVLCSLLPTERRPTLDATIRDRLTEYATVMRYPGADPDVSLSEARQAVAVARRVRKQVRQQLPRAALRRGTK
jgi:HEPN domain-containing protein